MDPFLDAHQIGPLLFDISGRTPISIRDQILRGTYVADALKRAQIIGPGRRLLVVGAGVGGATAAVEAARHGGGVDLIDAKPAPFSLQAGCSTRWIDPAQYDFVAPHWRDGAWPSPGASGRRLPFGFAADLSHRIATRWNNVLTANRVARPALRVRTSTGLTRWPMVVSGANPPMVSVWIGSRPWPSPGVLPAPVLPLPYAVYRQEAYHAVVLAYGVAGERTTVPPPPGTSGSSFVGLPFWHDDRFQQPDLGLRAGGRVLVSGSGDGALQDFIRLVTGAPSAALLWTRLLAAVTGAAAVEAAVADRLWPANEQAHRAMLWNASTDRRGAHGIQSRLHDAHAQAVSDLRASPAWSPIAAELDRLTAFRNLNVVLVHPCDHFGECYSLNRFLVLLLAAYLDGMHGRSALVPSHRVASTQPAVGHGAVCQPDCWDEPHEVTFDTGVTCTSSSSSGTTTDTFHGLVIRHGIEWWPNPTTSAPTLPARQSLPYQPPW